MPNEQNEIAATSLYNKIASILEESRKFVAATVNTAMVQIYFEIGKLIVEEEQHGNVRAEYGKETLKNLSVKLTSNYGKGFSVTNLKQMRDFYLTYQIRQTVSDQFSLSYSHYLFLIRIDNPEKRKFYEINKIDYIEEYEPPIRVAIKRGVAGCPRWKG